MPPIEPPSTHEQGVDTEAVEQHGLRAHHVGNGDDREIQPPGLAGRGIGRGRAGRAHAAADHVGADHEVFFGIDRQSRADHDVPPALLAGQRVNVGDMLVERQRMADQHGVGLVGVQLAIGLVGDLERREADAAIELERRIVAELAISDDGCPPHARDPTGCRMRIDFNRLLSTGPRTRKSFERTQANKRPGLTGFGRDACPLSVFRFIYVAACRPAQMTTEHYKTSSASPFRQDKAMVNPAARALGACPNRFVSFAFPLLSAPVLPNQCPVPPGSFRLP